MSTSPSSRRSLRVVATGVLALAVAVAVPAAPGSASASSGPFTIAVLPDTQTWTTPDDGRFASATSYLAEQRAALNLRQVLHTGDLVNWGWLAPEQFTVATRALRTLQAAAVPYLVAVGNHDTRAVGWNGRPGSTGYGGSAYAQNPECPQRLGAAECSSATLIRHTEAFDASVPDGEPSGATQYRSGEEANQFATFSAGGKQWLVLSLEFCPRPEVIGWAQSVVASHPTYNVIVQTHYYLDGDGGIGRSAGYGATSPQYLHDQLIARYPNIKLVFSGHTGETAYRVDYGEAGNRIVSMMLNDLGENVTNTMRLVTIDPAGGVVWSRLYAPNRSQKISGFDHSTTLSFVG